jgi:hypothetical protein
MACRLRQPQVEGGVDKKGLQGVLAVLSTSVLTVV